jgi:hypothetical protein
MQRFRGMRDRYLIERCVQGLCDIVCSHDDNARRLFSRPEQSVALSLSRKRESGNG